MIVTTLSLFIKVLEQLLRPDFIPPFSVVILLRRSIPVYLLAPGFTSENEVLIDMTISIDGQRQMSAEKWNR
jgi:hypothetical protein